ncbi:protein transport protein SEC16B homolog isoform X2 [Rhododendron vialii]|uniref:protein transport protein SEC16B homolog isoform X2 n=1 Tax=Rhododendron vialii TaxID=182163 RepID=UPI00265FD9B3|nr:protein transport protein SEC16B homolog isoform X2 [Rhododendron vialii]
MATAPPFQVEDQTDEDFFDKLVDDDDDGEFKPAAPAENGSDSDEAKTFANLSIGEEKGEAVRGDLNGASSDGNVEESRRSLPLSDSFVFDSGVEPDGVVLGTNTVGSLASSDSFVFDSVIESNDMDIGTEEVISDSAIRKSNESAGSGVKEVQWAAFNADSGEHASNGFGSCSDFFSELGDGAVDPLGKVEDNFGTQSKIVSSNEEVKTMHGDDEYGDAQYQENVKAYEAGIGQSGDELGINGSQYLENQSYGAGIGQAADGQDLNSSQSLEDLYPGWKYDPNTGQWYQIDGYDAANNIQGSFNSKSSENWAVSDGNSQASYLQHTAQSAIGTVTESGAKENIANWNQLSHGNVTTESVTYWDQASQETGGAESVSSWNQVSQGNNGYPAHMVFDPQYPDWYYDTIAQEWQSLETYISSVQSTSQAQGLPNQNGFASTGTFSHENDQKSYVDYGQVNASSGTFSHENEQKSYVDYGQVNNHQLQGFGAQSQESNWTGSSSNYNQPGLNMWQQPANVGKSEAPVNFSGKQQWEDDHSSHYSMSNHVSQQNTYESRGTVPSYDNKATQSSTHGFVPSWNFSQQLNQPSMQQYEQMHVSKDYSGNQSIISDSQQQFQTGHQLSFDPNGGRSSAGRPPHALVTFGFGGKLIVMKDSSLSASSYGSQGPLGGSISVLNVMEVVTEKTDSSSGGGALEYFNILSRQSFPGPLVGGNVGSKELNKWIDERIAVCKSPEVDYRKGEILQLLLSLLKISYQYYGKLRSPFGSDTSKESDVPEAAVARLFTSAKRNGEQFCDYGALAHCLQKLPSEGQMQATAAEVQTLLVSGRKKEALHCATEGKLWGPALVLAAQLGDQFYVDTVKQMAVCQLVSGSPLRTLCLLIAGQPADVFSADTTSDSSIYGAVNMSLQPSQGGTTGMLDNWEENLAVITANRTKDDELVLIHLGDCLWKDRSEIIAAHICYLVAEATFEPYSDSARLCLIGADHLKFPRTYASPDAIQRTELYEYSKLLGNAQFVLLPFQPYKLIYAHMLAEVGKVSESLKYCQAVLKSLKTGRLPEVDMWRKLVSSLEERIRTHQQGGYSTNSAPAKLVGKLLNLFDNTAHRVVGGLPPPVPSMSQGGAQANEHYQTMGPRVSTSQSTMAMSSLMPPESMEPISEWTAGGTRMTMHNRSVSEPDFGRTPRQVHSSTEASSSSAQGKASASRFGRFSFGAQLLQKTVGLVLKPRQDRQAKLGEQNRFYYDEKLKRWVEEGAEAPAEEAALPPPPTIPEFHNGMSDSNFRSASKDDGPSNNGNLEYKSTSPLQHSSGIPPIPSASNQFSARGRTGVRSRYVDTFNKGGGNPTNLFQSPSVPSVRPASGANPKFFVPSPVSSSEQTLDTTDNVQETTATNESSSIPTANNSFHSPPTSMTMQRFPSMDNILNNRTVTNGSVSLSSHSRRTASWSGGLNNGYIPPQKTEVKPLGEVLGMQPSSYVPSEPSLAHLPRNGGSFGDDLHEVEL